MSRINKAIASLDNEDLDTFENKLEELKNQGNFYFKGKNYEKATELFSKGIQIYLDKKE